MPMKFENLRFEVKLFINLYYPLILSFSKVSYAILYN